MNPVASVRNSTEVEVADSALCAAACREIYAQRDRWRGRNLNDQPIFYTLGAASYLDLGFAGLSLKEYLADADSVRDWAGEAIRSIFDRVRFALADHLAAAVEYPPHLPSPGFHIFIGRAIPRTDCARNLADCGSSHCDMQYEHIPWERWYRKVDRRDTISFTLPLRLPRAGGGLTIWDSLTLDYLRASLSENLFPDIPTAANRTPSRTIAYTVGSMVIHGGHLLHQMAGVNSAGLMDERITLQGHGIFADDVWRLYW